MKNKPTFGPSFSPFVWWRQHLWHHARSLVGWAVLACLALIGLQATALDLDQLLAVLQKRFGNEATQSFKDWQKQIDDAPKRNAQENLRRVNEFFNRRIQFGEDQKVWGQSDYWATPMETIGKGAGDCEDFAIAKYFTLLSMGIPNEQLRLVYVKARIGGASSTVTQAHMVLAWYATPDAEPLVLDNLITDIRSASRRTDLQPIFSFNSQALWQGAGGNDPQGPGGASRLSRWQGLLQRARNEGFD